MPSALDREFGPFVFDPLRQELRRGGSRLRLPISRLRLLALFLSRPGELITRDEIAACLWKNSESVDQTSGINTALNHLRSCLGDDPAKPKYIETVIGAGYRFIAKVNELDSLGSVNGSVRQTIPPPHLQVAAVDSALPHSTIDAILPAAGGRTQEETAPNLTSVPTITFKTPRIGGSGSRGKWAAGAIVGVILIAAGFYWWTALHSRIAGPSPIAGDLQISRLTASGAVEAANISPDGNYLAYVRNHQGKATLWLMQLASGRELQLVSLGNVFCPGLVFSPDGNFVYFACKHHSTASGVLDRIAILGGEPRQVLDGISGAPAISPDGQRIAFVRSTLTTQGTDSIVVANSDGSNERVIITYKSPGIHFSRVAFSADGQMLVYPVRGELMVIPVNGGNARALPVGGWRDIDDVSALPPGSDMALVGEPQDSKRSQLFLISLADGSVRQITHDLSTYLSVRATSDGKTLAGVQRVELSDIEEVVPGQEAHSKLLVTQNQNQIDAQGLAWTPDGKIIYSSQAEQRVEMTLVESDGLNPRQILAGSASITDLAVSPRGDMVVFTRWAPGDRANLWLVDMDGRHERKLTNGQQDFPAAFTPDGNWVVYGSIQGDKPVLMKVSVQGGTPLQLTNYTSDGPTVSPDGRWIACWYVPPRDQSPALAIVPIAGGPPAKTYRLPETARSSHLAWMPYGKAVSFIDSEDNASNIWQQPIAGGPAIQVTHFSSGKILNYQWSRDGRLVLSRSMQLSDAVSLKNFR